MQSIQDIISGPPVSNYTGSEATRNMVAEQIKAKWGSSELKNYDPYKNTALTFAKWVSLGYRVKKGEKALRSITFLEVKDANGNITKRIKHKVFLFYYKQVEKIKA
jgi:hypothetical protein